MWRQALREAGKVAAGIGAVGVVCSASDDHVHAPAHPWPHAGMLSAFDHSSIRRGHMVYQQVCASCHSMDLLAFRNLVGVAYSEEEMKAMAAEVDVEDGPNDEGEMFMRPGKLADRLPSPYPNEEAGRAANGGAYPPDLTLMCKARHGGADYIFALITGYADKPEGIPELREGLYYNPYFPGGQIGMPPPLMDGAVEFPDGTPGTVCQMAADVCTFLNWAAEPEMEERKLLGMKSMAVLAFVIGVCGYYKRFRWSIFKTRTMAYRQVPPRQY